MTTPWSQAVEEIAEWMHLSRHIVVPFVGAGISRAANLPTWRGLADAILDTVHGFRLASNAEIAQARNDSPLSALTFARTKLGDEMFRRQVAASLSLPADFIPPEIARLCWSVNDQLIVTTNLDDVLERASSALDGVAAQALTPLDSLQAALNDPGRRVLHLHGTLPRFDTWVMTASDYDRATAQISPAGATLQSLLLNRVILFLGYSCDDADLNLFLNRFRDHFPRGSTTHYALMPNISDDARRRLLDFGIFPIEYTPSTNSHPEVTQFLDAILTRYDPRQAELLADERSRQPVNMPLMPLADLRSMSFGARRDRLDQEFAALFEQSSNYELTASNELPPIVKHRRAETLELLAGAWQVDTVPPVNAIDGREVLGEVGRGGFGIVWLIEDVRSHERQALKVAHFQETSNYKFVERFKQGIRAMRRLTNHGIANTTKYISHREVPLCVIMEHIDGGDLGVLIKNVPLELETRVRLAAEIAEIVADAHTIPVYHRDLKPSNVLIRWDKDAQPHAVLSDFDLAWFEGAISRTTTRIGDQAFASPEQLKEGHAATQARAESDVYSLGMLLLFLATSRMPSAGQWYNRNLRREVFEAAERQFHWLRGAELFADLVMKCAMENPAGRPTARQVADELRTIHQMETTKTASFVTFIEEVRSRLSASYPDVASPMSWLHLEQRRAGGRAVVQASFTRQIRESDDRGRFRSQGEKAVKTLRTTFERHGWMVVSVTTTSVDAKFVMNQELLTPSLDFAVEVARQLAMGAESWTRWT